MVVQFSQSLAELLFKVDVQLLHLADVHELSIVLLGRQRLAVSGIGRYREDRLVLLGERKLIILQRAALPQLLLLLLQLLQAPELLQRG